MTLSTHRCRAAAVLAAAVALVASSPPRALAQGDRVDLVRKTMRDADQALRDDLPTQARAGLASAQKQDDALGEFEKDKVDAEFKSWRDSFTRALGERTGEAVAGSLGRALDQAEGYLSSFRGNPEQDDRYFNDQIAHVTAALADPENRKLMAADVAAKLERKVEWLKGEIPKAKTAGWIAKTEYPRKQIQDYLDGPADAYAGAAEAAFKQVDEALGHCPPDDPGAKDLRAKLAPMRQAFAAKVSNGNHDALVKPAIELWANRSKRGDDQYDGWESETTPGTLEVFLHGRKPAEDAAPVHHKKGETPDPTSRRREGPGRNWDNAGSVGCYLTERYLICVPQNWLRSETVKAALAKYPDDPDLKRIAAEARAMIEKEGGKVCSFANKVFDEADKLPPGPQRGEFSQACGSFTYELDSAADGCSAYAATKARMEALLARFKAEADKADADHEGLLKQLQAASDAAWPELAKSWEAKVTRLDAPAALQKIDDWKGKVVAMTGTPGENMDLAGRTWRDDYWFIQESDGVPLCGNLDDGLASALQEFLDRNNLSLNYGIEEVIGVVDGVCVAHERHFDGRTSRVTIGDARDGVRMRIVAVKTTRFALSLGQGTSFDRVPGVKTVAVPGTSSEGGVVHFVHRFVAWGMCALLALAGLLALAHGASKFVPQIQEQKVKLGDYLGYAGAGFAAVGVIWFGAAIVLPLIFNDVHFFSLPAIAMIFAGAACALDLARSKGKLKEETATTIQPAGILFGLVCFPAALLHLFLWDHMFF